MVEYTSTLEWKYSVVAVKMAPAAVVVPKFRLLKNNFFTHQYLLKTLKRCFYIAV